MALDMHEALVAEDRVVPVPAPREPALQLPLGCDHRGADSRDDDIYEPGAVGRLRKDLIPARELARVPMRILVDERARDHRPGALERPAQALQLLRLQPQLDLQVFELRRARLREV